MAKRKSTKVTTQEIENEVINNVIEETVTVEEPIVGETVEEVKEELVAEENKNEAVVEVKPLCPNEEVKVEKELTTDEKEDIRLVSRLEKTQEGDLVGLTPSKKKTFKKFSQVEVKLENNTISEEHTVYDGQVPTSKHVETGRRFGYAWNGVEYEF